MISILSAILVIAILITTYRQSRKRAGELNRFKTLFNDSAITGEKINDQKFASPEMQALARDANSILSERGILDDQIQEREALFRSVTESSPTGIFIFHGETIIYANLSMTTISGYSQKELIGMPFWHMIHPEMRELIKKRGLARQAGDETIPSSYQIRGISKNNQEKWLLYSAVTINYLGDMAILGNLLDITQQVEAQEALKVEQKKSEKEQETVRRMEAVGLLAGGIAHDFNNLLTGIFGNISLARLHLTRPQVALKKALNNLEKAERSADQARNLTQQLLTFAKGGSPVKELTKIAPIIHETANFSSSGSNVRLSFDIAEDLRTLEVDKGQFCQIINNLTINADQAMPEGGTLTIKAKNLAHKEIGNAVSISFSDEGIGIPDEHLEKIFDPYFTTKQQGSGLGLTTIHSIVRQHGGQLSVTSEVGKGTEFNIFLPATDLQIDKEKETMDLIPGSGRILIMDDEEIVLEVCIDLLTDLGYEVTSTIDGTAMLAEYKAAIKHEKPYDLVIMDLTIPGGMGGKEAISQLLGINPKAKAIVCSGYSNDQVMANYKNYGFMANCAKPFQFAILSRTIKDVLDT